jgi:hypothetical protein
VDHSPACRSRLLLLRDRFLGPLNTVSILSVLGLKNRHSIVVLFSRFEYFFYIFATSLKAMIFLTKHQLCRLLTLEIYGFVSPCILREHHSKSRQELNHPRSLRAKRFCLMEPCPRFCCLENFGQGKPNLGRQVSEFRYWLTSRAIDRTVHPYS